MSLPLIEQLVDPLENAAVWDVFVQEGNHAVRLADYRRCGNDCASASPPVFVCVVPDASNGMALRAGAGDRGSSDIVFKAVPS